MDHKEIAEKINSFPRWHYQFDLNGHLTPIFNEKNVSRHFERKRYFFDPLVGLLGGSLAGKRVLDLGCNAGYWSLQAIENGCEFVLGIDGRQMHVEQANFVFDVHQIDKSRYQFVQGDIFKLDFKEFGTFDIVLYLGLMYHINKPIELMEKISEVNRDILVIDTEVLLAENSSFKVFRESLDDPRNAVDYELVFIPSKKAVFDVTQQFGYDVHMLKPQFDDYTGAGDYEKGRRRAFLCAKETDLKALQVPEELIA